MKKIINKPESVVMEMLSGLVLAHPELKFNRKYKFIHKIQADNGKVTLISGGGSGHEPAHAGYIGQGMLDAAVCGDEFASPTQIQVYQAIREMKSDKGTLLIIKNYTGDMMNFKNAAYLAKEDGIKVDYVRVNDDIAVKDSLYTVGRRGVAGTVLVHKIAGAAAQRGYELEDVKAMAEKAIANVRSLGFALTSCTVPAKGTPTFHLEEDEMEFGIGIHGEPGTEKIKMQTADELAERIVAAISNDLKLVVSDEVTVLINGFGATPLQELYLLNNAVMRILNREGLKIYHVLVGNFMTSIDMAGASVSVMKMDDELKELLSDPCFAPALKLDGISADKKYDFAEEVVAEKTEIYYNVETDSNFKVIKENQISLNNVIYMVDKMSECIIKNEVPFCELDAHAGDGDFGMSLAKGFKQLKKEWKNLMEHHCSDVGEFLDACSLIIMEHCGGASGPIWGSAFRAAGKYAIGKKTLTAVEIAHMLQAAVEGIQATGERSFGRGAVVGDKTLIDALIPYADTWKTLAQEEAPIIEILTKSAEAAVAGAEKTKEIAARMGRAGNVGERSIGYPDAGAFGLGVIVTDIAEHMEK